MFQLFYIQIRKGSEIPEQSNAWSSISLLHYYKTINFCVISLIRELIDEIRTVPSLKSLTAKIIKLN